MRDRESFSTRCYKLLVKVPPGRVTTYGELARALGTRAYRAVGQAMHRNPDAPTVPCHRVVRSDGSLGGYAGGVRKKVELLKREGVNLEKNRVINLAQIFFSFNPPRASRRSR